MLPAVLGSVMVLASDDRDSVSRALSTRPWCWLGDRSYAVYLTHWPIAAWLFLSTSGKDVPLVEQVLGAAAAVLAGHALYQWGSSQSRV